MNSADVNGMSNKGTDPPSREEIAKAGLDVSTKQNTESIPKPATLWAIDTFLRPDGDFGKKGKAFWDGIFAQSITKVLKRSAFTPVKIVGWIGAITQPMTITVPQGDDTVNVKGLRITITDSEGENLESLTAPVEGYQSDLYDVKRENQRIVFCGAVVPVRRGEKSENRFLLWDIIPSWNAEDLIGVDPAIDTDPIDRICEEEGNTKHGIFEYIKRILISKLSITGLNGLLELEKCIDVIIYQAFSDGMNSSPRYSNRIHTLVIGPPGQGKGFLTEIGKILNPVSAQASTVGQKLSAAGLVGTVTRRNQRTVSQPGLLPLTSGGVLAFQDFHQLRKEKAAVLSIIAQAMEDGRVTDSTSAKATHEATTAVHLDMNRISQVDRSIRVDSYSDLGIPYNVISRFDFIVELPADLEGTLISLNKSFSGSKTLTSYPQSQSEIAWKRQLQRVVAFMRTRFREVEIPGGVNQYILDRVKEEFGLGKEKTGRMDEKLIQDNINRVSRSVLRFVKAIACADHNQVASNDDVDRAFKYVGEKLKFLATIGPADEKLSQDPRTLKVKERLADRLIQIKTSTFRTGDYVDLLGPFPGETERKSARQAATRDLERLVKGGEIKKTGQGMWRKLHEEKAPPKRVSPRKTAAKKPIVKVSQGSRSRKR
jgi:hypothetical protein